MFFGVLCSLKVSSIVVECGYVVCVAFVGNLRKADEEEQKPTGLVRALSFSNENKT